MSHFRERLTGEVRRIYLLSTRVNKGQLRTVGASAHEPLWRALRR
jgi:hypothetical protein